MEILKRKGQSSLLTINGITKSTTQWAEETGIDSTIISRRIRMGWTEDRLFQKMNPSPRYSFNKYYFDAIDDEHKAYWLGFIWCDGYMAIRDRNNRISYEFKLSLSEMDASHLEKFNKDINGNYKIHYYDMSPSGFATKYKEARLLITNQHFGQTLVEKYGLIPQRSDCSKILKCIPEHLIKHFIRGVIDADGSFYKYRITEKGHNVDKYRVSIGTNEDIVRFIENHLMNNGIINVTERKLYQRHEGQDGEYKTLEISSKTQALNILRYIYKDASIYLDRKYQKYLNIIGKQGVTNDEIQAI